jgi:hypothetical protein
MITEILQAICHVRISEYYGIVLISNWNEANLRSTLSPEGSIARLALLCESPL